MGTDINTAIVNRLEKERQKLGKTKSGFARECGMSVQLYHHIVSGESHITAERLYEVATQLGIPICEFYNTDGE